MGCRVVAPYTDETWRLWHTIDTFWPAIEVLTATAVSNARIEAAKTSVKQIKRISANRTGFRIQATTKPYPAQRRRATRGVNPLTRPATTVKCG